MINALTYIVLVIIAAYSFFILNKTLRKDYYKKVLPASIFFFAALIFPEDYFKKENVWRGWFMYLLSIITFVVAFYSLIKASGL